MASVLLVDDDDSILFTLAIALRRCGHVVTCACDGQQALGQLRRQKFDALVSDIRMPGMSGLELAARVHAQRESPRIVLTSAHSDPTLRLNQEEVADAFLQKPVDIDVLCDILDEAGSVPAPSTQRLPY